MEPAGFRRTGPDSIEVELPETIAGLVRDWALEVRRNVDDPTSAGSVEVFGKINEDAESDDPMLALERQLMIDRVCSLVLASWNQPQLTTAEAEAWLQVLGVALSLDAAQHEITSYEDVETLSEDDRVSLGLLQGLSSALAEALDATS